jgi:hypothetical protein
LRHEHAAERLQTSSRAVLLELAGDLGLADAAGEQFGGVKPTGPEPVA